MDRRTFLGTMAGCGAASLVGPAPTAFARGLAAPAYFGLFHIGNERGVSTALNPRNIPVYLWEESGPKLTPLGQWRPGRASSSLVIEFSLPADGYASVEMYNAAGERVKVLDEGWMHRGVHAATWNTGHAASGDCYCRMRAAGVDQATHVILAG